MRCAFLAAFSYDSVAMESRAERCRNLVLDATADVIVAVGVERMSVDEVARRSGVAKTTIYRHYPSKGALVAAAVNAVMDFPTVPDTGTLRGDILACFDHSIKHTYDSRLGSMMLSVMDAARRDPELQALLGDYTERRRRSLKAELRRAVATGVLPGELDVDHTVTVLTAPMFYTKMVLEAPVTPALVERVVDDVLAAIAARYGTPAPTTV